MVRFTPPTRSCSAEEFTEFTKWLEDDHHDEMENVYDLLAEISYKMAECDPSKPHHVHVQTIMNTLTDCLIIGELNHE